MGEVKVVLFLSNIFELKSTQIEIKNVIESIYSNAEQTGEDGELKTRKSEEAQ